MSSCGYKHRFVQEAWREGHVSPQGASGEVAKPKTIQTCDWHADFLWWGPVCAWWHLELLLAFGSPRAAENQFRARRGRGTVFRNSRISLSAGRRACEPAAKPAMPGVILVQYGFVCYERTPKNTPDLGVFRQTPFERRFDFFLNRSVELKTRDLMA